MLLPSTILVTCAKVEMELDRLVKIGVIEPVQYSDWASPIVLVVKQDGAVRICGDFKQTVNKVDAYPLPRVEDHFASLACGKSFTKLDLAHAYLQVQIEQGIDLINPRVLLVTHDIRTVVLVGTFGSLHLLLLPPALVNSSEMPLLLAKVTHSILEATLCRPMLPPATETGVL